MRAAAPAILLLLIASASARAQDTVPTTTSLSTLIQNIFGPNGLIVDSEALLPDGSTHSAHFNSAFQSGFRQFDIALASQLASVPLPSPAAGFTYSFDPATGTFVRSTQSFGPILADRAETIGRGKLSFGYNYQHFSFEKLEGVPLRRLPAVFTHDDAQLGGGRSDVVLTTNAIEASVGQFTGLMTYGVSDRLDLSLAVPVVRTRLSVLSSARIVRIGTADSPATHFFRDASGGIGSERRYFAEGTAAGLGDLVVRAKGTLMREGHRAFAVTLEARLPTGDEEDLLGSGTFGLKPTAVFSFAYKRLSPHLNIGYQWNGKSVLAGDPSLAIKADLPDRLLFTGGADFGVTNRLSLAVDFIGERVIDSPRLVRRELRVQGPDAPVFIDDITFERDSFVVATAAAGFKANLATNLLLNFNVLFHVGSHGLSSRVAPLLGVEFGF